MCFTQADRTNDPPPKPIQVLQQQQSTTSRPPANSNMGIYTPPAGHRPQGQQQQQAPPSDYAPPEGAPPSHSVSYAPPAGPPPSHRPQGSPDYAPPPGPPPKHDDYAPPTGPPPQIHDWKSAVPDTSGFPPPPAFFSYHERSSANNASADDARRGREWCHQYPLYQPLQLPDQNAKAKYWGTLKAGAISMFKPPHFQGHFEERGHGIWVGKMTGDQDTCLASYPPLYSVAADSPLTYNRPRTIYYEVHITKGRHAGFTHEVDLALGFVAPPFPPFRLPGWQRSSLGVHGDDGSRFINNDEGGQNCTAKFKPGETLGIGMRLDPGQSGKAPIRVRAFVTRNGKFDYSWDIHEELDGNLRAPWNTDGVTGLEGYHDLCAAVGVFNHVEFEIVFRPEMWKFNPETAFRS
ncbi:SPRY domain-containing protein [Xylariaceae sp. FL0255]|nr:SPRY domain-containing protein [Xylariaceae sp. FL0255]